MAQFDISYDFEDFGKDQMWLEAKYGSSGHPEYTLDMWRATGESEKSCFNGYYDWVAAHIAVDDEAMPSNGSA